MGFERFWKQPQIAMSMHVNALLHTLQTQRSARIPPEKCQHNANKSQMPAFTPKMDGSNMALSCKTMSWLWILGARSRTGDPLLPILQASSNPRKGSCDTKSFPSSVLLWGKRYCSEVWPAPVHDNTCSWWMILMKKCGKHVKKMSSALGKIPQWHFESFNT